MDMPALSGPEQQLQRLLLQEGLLTPAAFATVDQAREAAWENAWQSLTGIFCHLEAGRLCLDRYPSGARLSELPLESPSPAQPWGDCLLLVHPEDGRLLQSLPADPYGGLLVTSEQCFYLSGDPLDTPWLGQTHQFHGWGRAACDLTVSPRGDLLFVGERLAGRVHVLSLITGDTLTTLELRPPGHSQSLNVAVSPRGDKAYLTDQISGQLWMLDLGSWYLVAIETRLGILGNLMLSPDPRFLMLLVQSPIYSLVHYDLDSLSVLQDLELEGYPASSAQEAPTDLICLTPDQRRLLVLGWDPDEDDPGLSYPVVNLFRARTGRAARRYNINQACKPVGLMAGHTHPLQNWQAKGLSEWLIELGLIQAETLARLRQAHTLDALPRTVVYHPPQPGEAPYDLLKRPAPPIGLDAEAAEVVVTLLLQTHAQEHPEAPTDAEIQHLRAHFRNLAPSICTHLEQHYVALVDESQLPGGGALETLLTREAVLQQCDERLRGRELPFRPHHRCPMCQAGLRTPRLCPQCGFRLDDPAWLERREQMSAEACSALIPGQMLLALPHVQQIVMMNSWHQVLWEKSAADCGIDQPVYALALPERNYLIADRQGRRVVELAPSGEWVRTLDYAFVAPVMLSWYLHEDQTLRLLVVDQEARSVLEFNRQGQLTCQWGPREGVELQRPLDVQRSWEGTLLITDAERVLEIERSGQIREIWDRGQGLRQPVLARRQANGDTLIVDAALAEVLCFSPERRLIRRFRYWPPPDQADELGTLSAPDRVLVLPQNELLCMGPRYWLQLNITLEQLRWVKPWTGDKRLPRSRSVRAERSELHLLRSIAFLAQAPAEALELLAQHLQSLRVEAGDWILHQDELGTCMYFVASGEVEVLKNGSSRPVAVLGSGQLFGEMALILSEPRSASIRARSRCELLQLEREDFQRVMAAFPDLDQQLRDLAHQRKSQTHKHQHHLQQEVLRRVKARMAMTRLRELHFLAQAEPTLLEALADAMRPVAYLPRQTVFGKGESGDTLYLIARGEVSVCTDEHSPPVARLSAGDVFGEMALLLDLPRSATVRTETYCQFYELDRAHFLHLAGSHPDFQAQLQDLAENRLEQNQDWMFQTLVSDQTLLTDLPINASAPAGAQVAMAQITSRGNVWPLQFYMLSRESGQIWQLDDSGRQLPLLLENSLLQPERLHATNDALWISDTGNDRILCMGSDGAVLAEWAQPQLSLLQPRSAVPTPEGHVLIADEGHQRLILAGSQGELLWEFGAPDEIMSPVYAETTPTGTVLFCDAALQKVYEIEPRSRQILWSYGTLLIAGNGDKDLCEPHCARRLPNGGTLIADTGNDRLLLLDPQGQLIRVLSGDAELPLQRPVHCELLPNGEMLVFSALSDTVLRLDLMGRPYWRAQLV
ncbi:MAG: cyclic nucleotide-binding domain-containing protein [Candidatus Sericytochromatia bacterium]